MITIYCFSAISCSSVPKSYCFVSWTRHCYLGVFDVVYERYCMLMSDEGLHAKEFWEIAVVSLIGRLPHFNSHITRSGHENVLLPCHWVYRVGVSLKNYYLVLQFVIVDPNSGVAWSRCENWFGWMEGNWIDEILMPFIWVIKFQNWVFQFILMFVLFYIGIVFNRPHRLGDDILRLFQLLLQRYDFRLQFNNGEPLSLQEILALPLDLC